MAVKKSSVAVKKTRSRAANHHPQEVDLVVRDIEARLEGPARKTWSHRDIRSFRALTQSQAEGLRGWAEGDNVAFLGTAGTGKTLLASYCASSAVFNPDTEQDHIVIVRSAVQSRDLGFLPGTLIEKLAEYEQPYRDAFKDLFGRDATYDDMKAAKRITFLSTSFLRGVTFDNAVIILEEAQNMTFREIYTVMTRVGHRSRVIVTGDTRQCDFGERSRETSGLHKFGRIAKELGNFAVVEFNRHDIVRSGFVKSWICATEDYERSYGE